MCRLAIGTAEQAGQTVCVIVGTTRDFSIIIVNLYCISIVIFPLPSLQPDL